MRNHAPARALPRPGRAYVLGADPGAVKANGTTALMMAATSGNADAVKVLLDHGAEINAKEKAHGQTPIMFAAALNRTAVVKLLASRGGAPEQVIDLSAARL